MQYRRFIVVTIIEASGSDGPAIKPTAKMKERVTRLFAISVSIYQASFQSKNHILALELSQE